MNKEELLAVLRGQVVKSIDRTQGNRCDSVLEQDYLTESGSDSIDIIFESGLVMSIRSHVWSCGDEDGVSIKLSS